VWGRCRLVFVFFHGPGKVSWGLPGAHRDSTPQEEKSNHCEGTSEIQGLVIARSISGVLTREFGATPTSACRSLGSAKDRAYRRGIREAPPSAPTPGRPPAWRTGLGVAQVSLGTS
jgi:hypothetical protein